MTENKKNSGPSNESGNKPSDFAPNKSSEPINRSKAFDEAPKIPKTK